MPYFKVDIMNSMVQFSLSPSLEEKLPNSL